MWFFSSSSDTSTFGFFSDPPPSSAAGEEKKSKTEQRFFDEQELDKLPFLFTSFSFGSWFDVRVVVERINHVFKLVYQRTQTDVHLLHLWHWKSKTKVE